MLRNSRSMSPNRIITAKACEQCHKPLFGRTDKRFCNDTCRNTFNRQKAERERIKANENLPEILRIIKQNYELLKQHHPGVMEANEEVYFEKADILKAGFNPKFYTSVLVERDQTWYFVFERGWQMSDTMIMIRDVPEQALI